MCVAAIINKPVTLPDLQKMENENPHGGGVAWQDRKGRLRFIKGITAKSIFRLQKTALTFPYLLHFRWATHGDKIRALCHPFVVGPRALSGETKGTAQKLVIHNGIWKDYKAWSARILTEHIKIPSLSDTAVAAYFLEDVPELVDYMAWAVATAQIIDGRLCIERSGQTWATHDDNLYSNLRWIEPKWTSEDWGLYWARKIDNNSKKLEPLKEAYNEATMATDDGDWEDYVRARYGDEMVAQLAEYESGVRSDAGEANEDQEGDIDNLWDEQVTRFLNGVGEPEVSEDFDRVNSFLSAQMVG